MEMSWVPCPVLRHVLLPAFGHGRRVLHVLAVAAVDVDRVRHRSPPASDTPAASCRLRLSRMATNGGARMMPITSSAQPR